ncbi:MAG TPA: type II secretion system F family protein [Candidatus Ozemobacteraceae bacterium]
MRYTSEDIRSAFLTYFSPAVARRLQSESIGLFAINLSSGLPMHQTLDIARQTMPWPPFRQAMGALHAALANGMTLIDGLRHPACNILPPFVKIILAADLSDFEKGNVLQLKYSKDVTGILPIQAFLTYPIIQSNIIVLVFIAQVMFVLPQFQEIYMGLNIPLPAMTRAIMAISDLFVTWWFFVGPACIAVLFSGSFVLRQPVFKRFVHAMIGLKNVEFSEVLRIFSGVTPDRIIPLLQTIAHTLVLPGATALATGFADALGSGAPVDAVLMRHGIDHQTAWLVRLAVEGKGTTESFALAADLVEARAVGRLNRLQTILNTVFSIVLALIVGCIIISVFLPMIQILEFI